MIHCIYICSFVVEIGRIGCSAYAGRGAGCRDVEQRRGTMSVWRSRHSVSELKSLSEELRMRPGPGQYQLGPLLSIDEHPIGLDVTIPMISPSPLQGMVVVFRWEGPV